MCGGGEGEECGSGGPECECQSLRLRTVVRVVKTLWRAYSSNEFGEFSQYIGRLATIDEGVAKELWQLLCKAVDGD